MQTTNGGHFDDIDAVVCISEQDEIGSGGDRLEVTLSSRSLCVAHEGKDFRSREVERYGA